MFSFDPIQAESKWIFSLSHQLKLKFFFSIFFFKNFRTFQENVKTWRKILTLFHIFCKKSFPFFNQPYLIVIELHKSGCGSYSTPQDAEDEMLVLANIVGIRLWKEKMQSGKTVSFTTCLCVYICIYISACCCSPFGSDSEGCGIICWFSDLD